MCVKCGNTRQIAIASLPVVRNLYKIKCKCGHTFTVLFNKRKSERKKTSFSGGYSLENSLREDIIQIVDLSRTGLCFTRNDGIRLKVGQSVSIRFRLYGVDSDLFECSAVIRNLTEDRVGAEFVNMSKSKQTMLGFYLL